jgi:hypothetical protein
VNWNRIAAFAIALFLLPPLIAFVQDLLLDIVWESIAPTREDAVASIRPVRRSVIVLLGFVGYVAFLRRVPGRLAEHALALFVSVSLLLVAMEALLTSSLSESINARYVGAHVAIALAALVTTVVWLRVSPPAAVRRR